jgi:hypothetical protein
MFALAGDDAHLRDGAAVDAAARALLLELHEDAHAEGFSL